MPPIQFAPDDNIIEICHDAAFKATFTKDNPVSQGALRELISAYIGREVEILTVAANEPPVQDIRDRQIRYDIRIKFNQGELANVEMTICPQDVESLRLEYYTARLYSSQEIRGGDKDYNDLTHTYQISFIARGRMYSDEEMVHHFEYYDRELEVSLGGRTHIIVVELEKRKAEKPVAEMSPAERWAVFFRYSGDREHRKLVNELLREEEGIAMAGEALLTISRDEEERAWLESRFKYEMDLQAHRVEAKRKGLAEGRVEGLAEGRAAGRAEILEEARQDKLKFAGKMRAMGMSPEQIAGILGLSAEEIEQDTGSMA